MFRQLFRFGSFAILAFIVSCHDKEKPPSVVGVWLFQETELSSCSDASMNKIESCKGCYSYKFGSAGFYTIYNGAGTQVKVGRYRVEDNKIIFVDGDYEFTVTATTLTMIQRNWPVYTGSVYVYCNQFERYSRQ